MILLVIEVSMLDRMVLDFSDCVRYNIHSMGLIKGQSTCMTWIHSTKIMKPFGEMGTLVGGVTVMQEGAAPQSGRQSKTLF